MMLALSPASFQPLFQSSCSLSAWFPHSQGLWTVQEFKKVIFVCPQLKVYTDKSSNFKKMGQYFSQLLFHLYI